MPDEAGLFQTTGPSWSERAAFGELNAVLSPEGSRKRNEYLHGIHLTGARVAAVRLRPSASVLDFGCGTGRFLRYFGRKGFTVTGTEITDEMLSQARDIGLPASATLILTDGIHLPLNDNSIDAVWCCAVLRYSLFAPDPVYAEIALELFRVLKPGGIVVNVEMYVDNEPSTFTHPFEQAGFRTDAVRVLQRYGDFVSRFATSRFVSPYLARRVGRVSARIRCKLDSPARSGFGLRDYLFVWEKPAVAERSLPYD